MPSLNIFICSHISKSLFQSILVLSEGNGKNQIFVKKPKTFLTSGFDFLLQTYKIPYLAQLYIEIISCMCKMPYIVDYLFERETLGWILDISNINFC